MLDIKSADDLRIENSCIWVAKQAFNLDENYRLISVLVLASSVT